MKDSGGRTAEREQWVLTGGDQGGGLGSARWIVGVLNGIKPNRNWKRCRCQRCQRFDRLATAAAPVFVIKWNLARRLVALNASQCATIFISFNACRGSYWIGWGWWWGGVLGRRQGALPDNGKVHTNKCNKMIGMSRRAGGAFVAGRRGMGEAAGEGGTGSRPGVAAVQAGW